MCSELFRVPLAWLAQPIVGWATLGMLIAAGLVALFAGIYYRSIRIGKASEAWGSLPGFLLLAAVAVFAPKMFPEGLPIRGYGLMVLLGSLTGVGMAMHRARQQRLQPELILSLAFALFVGGIVGARLFYVIEYWDTRFQFDDWSATIIAVLKFTEGGLVVYGSLIGATLAFVWFVRKHQLPALALADLIAPSLLAGLALGRIGCLLNGCCYGGESNAPWAVTFPRGSMPYVEQVANGRMWGLRFAGANDAPPEIVSVQADSAGAVAGLEPGMKLTAINGQPVATRDEFASVVVPTLLAGFGETVVLATGEGTSHTLRLDTLPERSLPVHPTQFYSAVNAGLLSWVLWSFYPLRRRDGQVTALMLTAYPISRFLLEIIRIDESAVFGTGLSISQNISLVILVGATALWCYTSRRTQSLATFEPALA